MKFSNVQILPLIGPEVPLTGQTRVVFDMTPEAEDDPMISFWVGMDRIAKQLNIPPMCPCGERPHRIACPLGFEMYRQASEGRERKAR